METLTQAKKSFAEVKEHFRSANLASAKVVSISEQQIAIDQNPPGECRVRVIFDADPRQPHLQIDCFSKPNLAPSLTDEEPHCPNPNRRFDAVPDGSQFGWLEPATFEPLRTAQDIIEIVRALV